MLAQSREPFPIFGETSFNSVTCDLLQRLRTRIGNEQQAYILGVNEAEYLDHIVSEIRLEPPTFDLEHLTVSSREEQHTSPGFNVYTGSMPGEPYTQQVVTYHVPFVGDPALLRYQPSPGTVTGRLVYLDDGELCFDVRDSRGTPQIEGEATAMLNCIRTNVSYLSQNIQSFNQALMPQARQAFQERRTELRRRLGVLESLGVPLKKAASVPESLAVPVVRKRIPAPKVPVSGEPYKREWALDESIYQEILRVIHDTGRVFERLPSTYAAKDEETLRDHLILQLEPHFEWSSTTGETFNKAGKTDILVRYEKQIVFVAECKFWRGPKQHFETIDQILRYLTWRESKTAIVYFVDTKAISAPLKAIEDSTSEHPCFVAFKGRRDESQFSYEFHLPGDNQRTVRTAVLCFHLPRP